MELKHHSLVTIVIIMDLGKSLQWMLKLICESLRSNRILYNFNVPLHEILINNKE